MQNSIDTIQLNFNESSLLLLNACLGYMLFGIALDLRKEDFLQLLKNPRATLVGVLSQYLLFPLFTFMLIKILHPHPSIALGMILIAACPSGNISGFITHTAKGNTALSVSLTALSTLISPITTPLLFAIFGSMDAGTSELLQSIQLSFTDVLSSLFLLLLLPLLSGLAVRYYFPQWAQRSKKLIKTSSMLLFLFFILGALFKNSDIFVKYVYLVIGLVFVQDLIGFLTGYFCGRLFALSERDCRSISIETGIHNSGLGLVLIFSYFKGLGGMALIAAWWGIWHLIAGILLATYWSRKAVS